MDVLVDNDGPAAANIEYVLCCRLECLRRVGRLVGYDVLAAAMDVFVAARDEECHCVGLFVQQDVRDGLDVLAAADVFAAAQMEEILAWTFGTEWRFTIWEVLMLS